MKYSNSCKFPEVALEGASVLIKELHAAGSGHRPWAHPDVLAAMKPSSTLEAAAKRKHQDSEAFKERIAQRFAVKKEVYENCRMLSKNGDMLCFTDRKRLLWYIKKGLAVEVEPGKEPLTVRLTFDHKDDDQRAGAHEFYTSSRSNTCVACGAGKHYLRYRVVPVCYRRALPEKFKSHRSHDVLLLCMDCHEVAQRASEQMKREISNEFGIPLFPWLAPRDCSSSVAGAAAVDDASADSGGAVSNGEVSKNTTPGSVEEESTLKSEALHPFSVRKAAVALSREASTLPTARREELEQMVSTYTRAVEPWLNVNNTPSDAPFTQNELWAGLLAGMSKPTRRKTLRRWIAEGHQNEVPAALLQELDISGTEKCNAGVDMRDGMGHSWHGQQVVELLIKNGGDEALSALCAHFRKAFIEALNPKYLPSGWKVDHTAPRTFGEHSIYAHEHEHENGNGHSNGRGVAFFLPESLNGDEEDEEQYSEQLLQN
jgi:cation-transporting P-type ATPase D